MYRTLNAPYRLREQEGAQVFRLARRMRGDQRAIGLLSRGVLDPEIRCDGDLCIPEFVRVSSCPDAATEAVTAAERGRYRIVA